MGGSYYPTTQTAVLIGSKSGTTRTSIEMESSYQAESTTEATKSFETAGFERINFDLLYTMGGSETSNSIEVKIEGSPDKTNWYRLANDATSGATSTLTAREFTFVGANGAATSISIILDVAYRYMRISVKETGVSSNKGSVYCEATLVGR